MSSPLCSSSAPSLRRSPSRESHPRSPTFEPSPPPRTRRRIARMAPRGGSSSATAAAAAIRPTMPAPGVPVRFEPVTVQQLPSNSYCLRCIKRLYLRPGLTCVKRAGFSNCERCINQHGECRKVCIPSSFPPLFLQYIYLLIVSRFLSPALPVLSKWSTMPPLSFRKTWISRWMRMLGIFLRQSS